MESPAITARHLHCREWCRYYFAISITLAAVISALHAIPPITGGIATASVDRDQLAYRIARIATRSRVNASETSMKGRRFYFLGKWLRKRIRVRACVASSRPWL